MPSFITEEDFVFSDSIQREVESLSCPFVKFAHLEEVLWKVEQWGGWPKYLFSGGSDMGLWKQQEAFPNGDLLATALSGYDWAKIAENKTAYLRIQLGPACNLGSCDPAHQFSVRTDRFTHLTLDEPPENVHWHTANLCTDGPRLYPLPFGLNPEGNGRSVLASLVESIRSSGHSVKKHWLYVNHRDHTHYRLQLNAHYHRLARSEDWVTHRGQVPVDQYLEELSHHSFVLCPGSCGEDSFRVWEAVALGSIPILEDSVWARHIKASGLPVVLAKNLMGLTKDFLKENLVEDLSGFDYSFARMSHWKGLIQRLTNQKPHELDREDFLLG